jgi:hypothetical protein
LFSGLWFSSSSPSFGTGFVTSTSGISDDRLDLRDDIVPEFKKEIVRAQDFEECKKI